MGLSAKVATFTWSSADAAGTTYDVTLGFQPAFVFVCLAGAGSAGSVSAAHARISLGAAISDSARAAAGYGTFNAQANGTYSAINSSNFVATGVTGASSPPLEFALDVAARASWPADGIRFVVDDQTPDTFLVTVLGIGGTDITAAAIGSFQEPGTSGSQAVPHGLGVIPTGALFFSTGYAGDPAADTKSGNVGACPVIGAFDGTNGFTVMQFADDAAGTMNVKGYARSGEVIALGDALGNTLDARASGTSCDLTNINLNWSEVTAGGRRVFFLVWKGGQFAVGSTSTRTNTTAFDGPAAGFTPLAALFASAMRAESTADTPTDHGQFSLGMATGATERSAQADRDRDGVGTSDVVVTARTDAVYVNLTPTAATVQGLMDVADLTVDPMQLVMDDADPSACFVGVAMWGASPAASFQPGMLRHNVLLGGDVH